MYDSPDHESKVYQQGKFVVVERPEIYFQFVKKLMTEHKDILSALNMANLSLDDGSALSYLNTILGTDVKAHADMGSGYQVWYDALVRRTEREHLKSLADLAESESNVINFHTKIEQEHWDKVKDK